jgi:hypothetical protein
MWGKVLLKKVIVSQLVMKFAASYETLKFFIIIFTRSRHWSLSWARCIQSTTSYPIPLRSNLILSSYLRPRLPSGLFPSGVATKILHAFLVSPMRVTSTVHLYHPNNIWWNVQVMKLLILQSSPFSSNPLPISTVFSNTITLPVRSSLL